MIKSAAAPADPIVVDHIVKSFGNFRAVDDVSFTVPRGTIFGLLGANGAGKSTLIRMLCGILQPSSGAAAVAGIQVATQPDEVKRRIGYMSQTFSLYRDLTVRENIRLFAGIYGIFGSCERERATWAMATAGLEGRQRVRTGALSGGYRQRLALVCALLHRPAVLFLDEPTSGVDPVARRGFWDLIDGLASGGTTVLVTTHYLDEADYCHRLAMLHNGRVVAAGTARELRQNSLELPTWEIRTARPYEIEGVLRSQAELEGLCTYGRRFHVRGTEAAIERLRRRTAGLASAITIEPVVPNLEDVFIALTERADGEQA